MYQGDHRPLRSKLVDRMLPVRHLGERLPPAGQGAEVAVALLVLNHFQLVDEVGRALS